MGPRSDSPVLAPIAGEAMGPPLGQPPFVLSGRKDVSTGSRFRAKRGGPVLAPIAGVAMGPPLGQPPFVLSGRKDMSPGSRLRAKRGGPVLAPIGNGDGLKIDRRDRRAAASAVGARPRRRIFRRPPRRPHDGAPTRTAPLRAQRPERHVAGEPLAREAGRPRPRPHRQRRRSEDRSARSASGGVSGGSAAPTPDLSTAAASPSRWGPRSDS
jgi:hypothetical protein